jgi:hypothetical protein
MARVLSFRDSWRCPTGDESKQPGPPFPLSGAAAVLLMFSALPLLGVGVSALGAIFDVIIGVVLLIAVMGDHRLLTETLHPPKEGLA